jgi:hypothetical protein
MVIVRSVTTTNPRPDKAVAGAAIVVAAVVCRLRASQSRVIARDVRERRDLLRRELN